MRAEMLQDLPHLDFSEDVFDYGSDDDPECIPCEDLDESDEEDKMDVQVDNNSELVHSIIQEPARHTSNHWNQEGSLVSKVREVCNLLTKLDLNIGDFLYALSWGDVEC